MTDVFPRVAGTVGEGTPRDDAAFERGLRADMGRLAWRPLQFVRYAFPWGRPGTLLENYGGPWDWQLEVLANLQEHLLVPATRHKPFRQAVSSGHGVGKSALISMLTNWAMSTFEDTKVVITAGTGAQLKTKTVPEINKWIHLAINHHWWEVKAMSVSSLDPRHERTWRTDLLTWSSENPEAFAGLHNKDKRILIIYDEASAIAKKIWETTEGALTDTGTEIIWLAFGNPTRGEGEFFDCFNRNRHLWHALYVDSRTVPGAVSKAQVDEWAKTYGEDSDFMRVRVRGEFPRVGTTQFISPAAVEAARQRRVFGYEKLPLIMAIDVARFGDDETTMGIRRGRWSKGIANYRGLPTDQVAERAIEHVKALRPDALVVDGDGLGAGVVDHLRLRGYQCFEFHGGEAPRDADMYFNRRSEVWGLMREWLATAAIDDDPVLAQQLTGPQYGLSAKGQIQLESKKDMKARGVESPDRADWLAMTFGVDVAAPKTERKTRYVDVGEPAHAWMGG